MVEAYAHQAARAYRSVRLWIAPSRFVQEKALEHGVPAESLRVLPHGVESPEPAGTSSVPRSSVPGGSSVLFYGRLSVEKGVRLLPALAMRLAPIPVHVVGDGPLRASLDRAADTQPNLHLLGHVADDALGLLRAAASAVVVPSLFYEHFCYAAAEALLDRKPVIASRIGAIPELVEHEATGLLVPPGDAAALADAARRALSDPDAGGWGESGRARVTSVGEPRRHVEGLLAIYREAMSAN